ncbi:N-6 DNA methylase [Erysipelothrix rhusiopathiae]|nr:N-6 DNA methylase [Erysipelothrix rhusiopathiae]MDE8326584.1 N-6 DNA methylase [Erysipelothrix rhusiopathiae]
MKEGKSNDQIFTPNEIVKKMVDISGFLGERHDYRILENSFGEGAFLVEIVSRIIDISLSEGFPPQKIKRILEENIFGVEKDGFLFDETIRTLNEITNQHQIDGVKWNLFCTDFLNFSFLYKFDLIIGNPPYIKYSALMVDERESIKGKFSTCQKGNPDLYYAFVEHGKAQLKPGGVLTYIIPNNVFKTRFGLSLREHIKKDLVEIYDYKSIRVFEGVLISTAIIKIVEGINSETIVYRNCESNEETNISKESLKDKWIFDYGLYNPSGNNRFGDLFKATNSMATLLNDAFVLSGGEVIGNYYINNNLILESALIKQACSPRNMNKDKKEYIIFPYKITDCNIEKLNKYDLKKNIKTLNYLESKKMELLSRDSDKSARWFEYGRSQSLNLVTKRKIVLSTIISGKVKYKIFNENVVPYSGICIIQNDAYGLEVAAKVLQSDEFKDYVNAIGINVSGNSIRISARDINEFRFDDNLLD